MCGIFGTINYEIPVDQQKIFQGLWHRGPDEQDRQSIDNLHLYHTRLAIQDLSPMGKQPMEYNGLMIAFNGEIYNHLELREKYGLESASNSDTRTILMMYELMGMKMLEEFDGMFAFALYDLKNRMLYLARDRAGKKPLFIYRKGNTWMFSSELNILSQIAQPEIDYAALSDYLYLGYHYRKSTPYLHVSELENGHYLKLDPQNMKEQEVTWFNMEEGYRQESKLNHEDSIAQLDHLLQFAVHRRMDSSDLDVGSFLSGGIDSGLVTAIAAKHASRLNTFTVRLPGSYDESGLAAKVAKRYGTNHTVVDIDFSSLQDDIETILSGHGEPNCDNSAIPSYYVAKAAKQHTTVVLNGDGADELFGGYRRYVPFRHLDFFQPNNLTKISAKILAGILPIANEKQSYYTYLYRLLKFASYTDVVKIYCSASSDLFVGFEDQFLRRPLMKDISADLLAINKLPLSALNKILLMDFQSMLFSRLLPKMDIATMAHSLEGRSPFLSKELLEFAPGLPDHFKIHNVTTKSILRDLAVNYLPEELINQPKRGFEIPLRKWVDEELKTVINDYLLAKDTLYSRIIKKSFIEDLIAKKIRVSDERRAKMLFCVFGLEVWYKKLIQKGNAL
ncbi:asparagine synthase (glutamine-hydrolysing) [Pedobacter steynii]|uniref:asparagine synthase (glutamine-hydrolyzing) n=1 Tax=Pedobacter steynii TaxID=430522 RepID=A0A1H0JAW2_9SPHI|nr:asparagine synthase (glutamine-hydrolyzing) [Pedobacter steynii]NQX43084.1 asparagine synthase (glutamine-hydrolyzing) [Pedobacter steynii]SDO40816.1 asparagine synthase (glutamine-hydrolysing) [Pedobacter steynii]